MLSLTVLVNILLLISTKVIIITLIVFYIIVLGQRILGCLSLVLASLPTFYTFGLIAPLMISCAPTECKRKTGSFIITFLTCVAFSCSLLFLCYTIMGEWTFLDSVYGFMYVSNIKKLIFVL